VTWDNVDTAGHTATDPERAFDTGPIDKGQSKTLTLSQPGTYHYICDFHPFMKATIVVR
jgi:plastocyanin